jgi:threonine dehydrogenase-like Zn-dependent dehydrogenase
MSSFDYYQYSTMAADDQKQQLNRVEAMCMATAGPNCDFKPQIFTRRAVGPHDVLIDMKFCGVCHTDLHTAAGHLENIMPPQFPCVPGHELSGVCVQVGDKVTKFKVGDQVNFTIFVFCITSSNQFSRMHQLNSHIFLCLMLGSGWRWLHG